MTYGENTKAVVVRELRVNKAAYTVAIVCLVELVKCILLQQVIEIQLLENNFNISMSAIKRIHPL